MLAVATEDFREAVPALRAKRSIEVAADHLPLAMHFRTPGAVVADDRHERQAGECGGMDLRRMKAERAVARHQHDAPLRCARHARNLACAGCGTDGQRRADTHRSQRVVVEESGCLLHADRAIHPVLDVRAVAYDDRVRRQATRKFPPELQRMDRVAALAGDAVEIREAWGERTAQPEGIGRACEAPSPQFVQQCGCGMAGVGHDGHVDAAIAREFFRLDVYLDELRGRREPRRQPESEPLLQSCAEDQHDIRVMRGDLCQRPAESRLPVLRDDAAPEAVADGRQSEFLAGGAQRGRGLAARRSSAGDDQRAPGSDDQVRCARDRRRVRMRDCNLRPRPQVVRRLGEALREELLRNLQHDGPRPTGECATARNVDVLREPRGRRNRSAPLGDGPRQRERRGCRARLPARSKGPAVAPSAPPPASRRGMRRRAR